MRRWGKEKGWRSSGEMKKYEREKCWRSVNVKLKKTIKNNYKKMERKKIMTWLNVSAAALNATFQLLVIYRLYFAMDTTYRDDKLLDSTIWWTDRSSLIFSLFQFLQFSLVCQSKTWSMEIKSWIHMFCTWKLSPPNPVLDSVLSLLVLGSLISFGRCFLLSFRLVYIYIYIYKMWVVM